jgi:hypothetical protein
MPLSGKEFIDEIQEMVQRKHSEERTPNMLNALIKQVEEGQEPESILASRVAGNIRSFSRGRCVRIRK